MTTYALVIVIDLFYTKLLISMKHPIIDKLKSERKSQNISMRQLAEMSDVAFTNIYSIENGKTSPSLVTAEKIANALGKKITIE